MTELLLRLGEELVAALAFLAHSLQPHWVLPRGDRETHGGSSWARRSDARRLGRLVSPEGLAADGIVLGWLGRRLLQSPREDNVLLLGVQRSGKTSTVAVPTLLGWQGPVVATSTKEELVRLTARHRSRSGPVWVFAPLDRDHAWMESLGVEPASWNPVDDAVDCGAAAELADLFTAEGKRGPSSHWYLSAANLLTGLLAFAHERDGDIRTVLITLNRTAQAEYLALAGVLADQTAADLLVAFSMTPDREAGSIASTARSCLSLWIDERVALATGAGGNQIDLDRLLADAGTLYLVAPAEEAERCRPLFTALIASLLRRATTRARGQGGALSPRLLVALDEAANFARIPRLAGYASSGPGQGIQLLLCYHDLAQIESAYGSEEARTIWNNCRARLLLPGQGDLKTLEHFSRAIGDETRIYDSAHHSRRETSSSEQRTGRPLITVDELRRLDRAVLLYANAPPARLSLRRWDQVPAWRALVKTPPPRPAAPVFPPHRRRTTSHSPQGKGMPMNYLDIQVHPNFDGLPPSVHQGLIHLTNNAAGLLTLVSALGIVVSILLMVIASWTGSRELSDRAKGGLLLSVVAMGILYLGIAVANYTGALFS